MEKIEKLKIPKTKYQLGIKDDNGENLIELKMVGEKVNEIIDRMNEQPVVKKNLTTEKPLEDTAEEREDWKGDLFWKITHIFEPADIVRYVTKLLEERERETLEDMTNWVVEYYKDKWQIRDFDAEIAIQKLVEKKVSKLNNK